MAAAGGRQPLLTPAMCCSGAPLRCRSWLESSRNRAIGRLAQLQVRPRARETPARPHRLCPCRLPCVSQPGCCCCWRPPPRRRPCRERCRCRLPLAVTLSPVPLPTSLFLNVLCRIRNSVHIPIAASLARTAACRSRDLLGGRRRCDPQKELKCGRHCVAFLRDPRNCGRCGRRCHNCERED